MTGMSDQDGEEPTIGTMMALLIGETTSPTEDGTDGMEIGSELTGIETELLMQKTVGEDLVETGLLELGIQHGEVKDGDQKQSQ